MDLQLEFNTDSPLKRAIIKRAKIMTTESKSIRLSQQERIFKMLYDAWLEKAAVPLTSLLNIASHTARISELRNEGWNIDCRTWEVNGDTHSEYRIIL